MAKERISSNVSSELATQIKRTAKKAGLSVSAFIEKAVEGLLGRSCHPCGELTAFKGVGAEGRLYQ